MTEDHPSTGGHREQEAARDLRRLPAGVRLLSTSVCEGRWGDMDAFGHVENGA
jgi:hypothetical protein